MLHSVIGNTADFGSAIEESYSSGATIKKKEIYGINDNDSLTQLVEYCTFNAGVVGSSPTRITNIN